MINAAGRAQSSLTRYLRQCVVGCRGAAHSFVAVGDLAGVGAAPARIQWRSSIPFFLVHVIPFAALFTGITLRAIGVFVMFYGVRMFCITAGYHRCFAHRSFRVSRPVRAALAFGATTAAQKGPLWWAAHHRAHHRHTDRPGDVHSPSDGFWWSHAGWVLSDRHKAPDDRLVADLAVFPELRWLDRHDWVGPWTLALVSFLVAGWSGLVVGFFASTVAVWHATFSVNSVAHLFGRRRYDTPDTSRNCPAVALVTFGEGWHNNHHRFPASARQGHAWWELDLTYVVLRTLARVGVVHDLRLQPIVASDLVGDRVRGT